LFTVAGEQVSFRTRKHLALLIRLALEPGKQFTRDYLADLLWPNAAPPLANHSLAQGLSVIKAKIAREAVLLQRSTVGLAAGWIDVDVTHLASNDVAIDGPFLEAFEIASARPFEDWKDEYRARLIPQLRDSLVRQMDAARRIGDFPTVQRHAERLQDLDPLAEEAIRGIMEARAWASDRSGALKTFARYEARLADELGAKPGADLVRMTDLLRDGRRSPSSRATPGYPPERADRRFEPEILIGREHEFGVLSDAWHSVRQRAPQIVILTGEPGVGKTTLINAFASRCQMEGAVVSRAQAYDAERELPFAVVGELVKQLALQRAIGGADPEALGELTRISSEIIRAFPGVPRPVEWTPELTPLRIADALLKATVAAAADNPMMLIVDDVHAADNASIAIIHTMARKLSNVRALIVLAGRVSELRLSSGADALTSDDTLAGFVSLELEAMSSEAARTLVTRLGKPREQERTDVPVDRILRAARGNPLALELLTREWITHGSTSLLKDIEALDTQPATSVGIPRAIAKVFERESRRLDGVTRGVLDTAAVLGRRLSALDLYAASDISTGAAADALMRLRDQGLLREVRGELEFRNELIRAQAYYAIAAPIRQSLHARVANLLSKREGEGGAPNLETAWHYLRGGSARLATPFGIAGAELALAAGAPAEAQQILEALLAFEHDDRVSRSMQVLLVKALLDRSDASKARPLLEALLRSESLTPRDRADITRLMSNAEFLLAKSPRGLRIATAQIAVEAARQAGEVELVLKALFEYARTCKNIGDDDGMRQTRSETLEIIKSGCELPAAHLTIAYCDYYTNEIRSALASLEHVAQQNGRDLAQLFFIHNGIGSCYANLCEFPKAIDYLRRGLEIAEKVGDDSKTSRVLSNMSHVCTTIGQYGDAIHAGCRSIELGKRNMNQPELVTAYVNVGDAYLLTGDTARAAECLERAKDWIGSHDDWYMTVTFLYESASRALATGNVPLALSVTREIDRITGGSHQLHVQGGLTAKLDVLRAFHDKGPESAWRVAVERKTFYDRRVPNYYLDALAACAWIERTCTGSYSSKTTEELRVFELWGATGKKALLQAQGFLT
jgi:DNA-binding SARP family transcriptional activator/tetratricopeptide (TPR) repeat protein